MPAAYDTRARDVRERGREREREREREERFMWAFSILTQSDVSAQKIVVKEVWGLREGRGDVSGPCCWRPLVGGGSRVTTRESGKEERRGGEERMHQN